MITMRHDFNDHKIQDMGQKMYIFISFHIQSKKIIFRHSS